MASAVDDFETLCRNDPLDALSRLSEVLANADDAYRSSIYRCAALAARQTNELDQSDRFLERAIAAAANDPELLAEAELTRSYNLFLRGRGDAALALVEQLKSERPQLRARISFQHGTLLARSGRAGDALTIFRRAGQLAAGIGDDLLVALVAKNLGSVAIETSALATAAKELTKARAGFEALGLRAEVGFVDRSLGLVAAQQGDLPTAFARLEQAAATVTELTGSDFESQRALCDALLQAGLYEEAAETARRAAEDCRASGLMLDAAELATTEVAALIDLARFDQAAEAARSIAGVAAASGHDSQQAKAVALNLEATHRAGHPVAIDDVESVVDQLNGDSEVQARLLLADLCSLHGQDGQADQILAAVSGGQEQPLNTQLAVAATSATIHLRRNQIEDANAIAADGLNLLRRIQATVGSATIRAGLKRHGDQLAEIGLRTALAGGKPADALAWIERVGTTVHAPRPVRSRPVAAAKGINNRLRAADEANRERREIDVEKVDRQSSTTTHGSDRELLPVDDLIDDGVGLVLGTLDDDLVACRVSDGSVACHRSANIEDITRRSRSLVSGLRRVFLLGTQDPPQRIDAALEQLDQALFGQIDLGAGPLRLAPGPQLFDVPWTLLPSFRDRSVTVAPTLTSAALAEPLGPLDQVALIAGPDLAHATAETDAIAELHADVVSLVGSEASVDRVLAAVDGCSAAHIVAHGSARSDNPLLSSLRLTDGELTVYRFAELQAPPALVVLSACDVSRSGSSAGKEMLGVVTGLLNAGVRCVVSSSLPVPDGPETIAVMRQLHEQLIAGASPSAAMADIRCRAESRRAGLVAAAFTVFGRG